MNFQKLTLHKVKTNYFFVKKVRKPLYIWTLRKNYSVRLRVKSHLVVSFICLSQTSSYQHTLISLLMTSFSSDRTQVTHTHIYLTWSILPLQVLSQHNVYIVSISSFYTPSTTLTHITVLYKTTHCTTLTHLTKKTATIWW